MDFRTALLGVLFIIVISPFGTSQDVPDGVVYTELKKTLVSGIKGVLTCRFKGTPNAVYWRKGSNPDTAPFVMSWGYGTKYGPRYEDGSCDINANYSLVIKTVRDTDAGRYICRVSNYKGVLMHNYTDVTISNNAVKTEPNIAVQMGKVGVLPCKVLIRPRKVTWMKGVNSTLFSMNPSGGVIDISGPGHEGVFNITKDYSLVINDVILQHEDNYFCEVTDFDTGLKFRDLTALSVFAQPAEPFPTIEGCPIEDHTNCIITTDSSITLTCQVNEYHPDINLFFVHGSTYVEPLTNQTWYNSDGTKNTSITISAGSDKDTYKCIASAIPGFDPDNVVSASVRLIEKQRHSLIFIVILVPIVICLTVILLTWMRIRKKGRCHSHDSVPMEETYMEGFMKGHISYVELCKLVENVFGNHENHKLDDVITLLNERLKMNESRTNMDQDRHDKNYYYKKLCEWKETCDQTMNQWNVLSDICSRTNLKESFAKVEDFRKSTSHEVPPCDLEHILWQINEPQKIRVFLSTLGVDIPEEMQSLRKKCFTQEVVKQLEQWTKGSLPFSAVVILSSALEKLGHCKEDDNFIQFFQIPAQMKQNIDNQELKRFVTNTWRKELLKKFIESIRPCSGMLIGTLEENEEVLFNTERMLLDWWEDAECSNYEKRLILEKELNGNLNNMTRPVVKEAIDPHLSYEELKLIAGHLNSKSMGFVCHKLRIAPPPEDSDEQQRFEVLYQWRASMNEKDWTLVYGQLTSALEEFGAIGILPPLRSDPVHMAEYLDIAFDIRMTDVLPIAKALGINVNKLAAYRPVFEPSHLERGTIRLVAWLVESLNKSNSRQIMCSRLTEAGFPISIVHRMLVYPVGYGELYAISDAMMGDDCKQGVKGTSDDEEKPSAEGDSLLSGNDSTPKNVETFAEQRPSEKIKSEHLRDIKKMLKLTEEEVEVDPLLETECLDEFALFKVWKERPHSPLFNERAAIIQGLIDIERPETARSVVEGKYRTTGVSLRLINHIVTRMDEKKLRSFVDTFDLQKEFEKMHCIDNVSLIINGFLKNLKHSFPSGKKSKVFWDLSDKLVGNGFLDIARELIIIHK